MMVLVFFDVIYLFLMIDNSCDCSLFICMGKLRNKKIIEIVINILCSFLCVDRDLFFFLIVFCLIFFFVEKMFVCFNWYVFENVLVLLFIYLIV